MAKEQINIREIRERDRVLLKIPRHYKVVIYNDDVTTMDFVVRVLKEFFFMDEKHAEQLMLQIHHQGKAALGPYTLDVARSKAEKAMRLARSHNFPLRLTVEPEE